MAFFDEWGDTICLKGGGMWIANLMRLWQSHSRDEGGRPTMEMSSIAKLAVSRLAAMIPIV